MFSLHDPDPDDEQERCPVVVSLAQKINTRGREWSIGFRIYKVNTDDVTGSIKENPSPVGITKRYFNLREVSQRFELPIGDYCVIPSTFNSGEEGDFLIKVFVEKHWGDSDESDRMSFRLSSSSINSSANPSPDVTPDLRRRLETATGARPQNLNAASRRKQ